LLKQLGVQKKMSDYVALIMGVICAGIGGELFVRGAVGLAHWARISPGIIGATVAALAPHQARNYQSQLMPLWLESPKSPSATPLAVTL
jgi:hypothetical protein